MLLVAYDIYIRLPGSALLLAVVRGTTENFLTLQVLHPWNAKHHASPSIAQRQHLGGIRYHGRQDGKKKLYQHYMV